MVEAYQAGGSGDINVLLSPEKCLLLFADLKNWNSELNEGYNPGWKYKTEINMAEYIQMIACQKAIGISKLDWFAKVLP